jgi:hypothetical protein
VCEGGGQGTAGVDFGLDAASGTLLWRIGGNTHHRRLVPQVTTAWHGEEYGKTSNGPVVLGARTGKDGQERPGVAPIIVDAYTGLVTNEQRQLRAHRATG